MRRHAHVDAAVSCVQFMKLVAEGVGHSGRVLATRWSPDEKQVCIARVVVAWCPCVAWRGVYTAVLRFPSLSRLYCVLCFAVLVSVARDSLLLVPQIVTVGSDCCVAVWNFYGQ